MQDILTKLRVSHRPDSAKDPKPVVTEVITASFSAGVKYMHTFLSKAVGLRGVLREVFDFDGRFSSEAKSSGRLASPGVTVKTYDQTAVALKDVTKEVAAGRGIHAPDARWRDLPGKLTSFLSVPIDVKFDRPLNGSNDVHAAIARYLMLHALDQSAPGKP